MTATIAAPLPVAPPETRGPDRSESHMDGRPGTRSERFEQEYDRAIDRSGARRDRADEERQITTDRRDHRGRRATEGAAEEPTAERPSDSGRTARDEDDDAASGPIATAVVTEDGTPDQGTTDQDLGLASPTGDAGSTHTTEPSTSTTSQPATTEADDAARLTGTQRGSTPAATDAEQTTTTVEGPALHRSASTGRPASTGSAPEPAENAGAPGEAPGTDTAGAAPAPPGSTDGTADPAAAGSTLTAGDVAGSGAPAHESRPADAAGGTAAHAAAPVADGAGRASAHAPVDPPTAPADPRNDTAEQVLRTEELAESLRASFRRGERSDTLSVQLHPAELGSVRIEARLTDGVTHLVLRAESAAAVDRLGAAMEQLRHDLSAHGVDVGDLELRHGGGDGRGGDESRPDHAARHGARSNGAAGTADTDTRPVRRGDHAGSIALDL